MKKYLLAVVAFSTGMALHWIAGAEFVRGETLFFSSLASGVVAAFVCAFPYEEKPRHKRGNHYL